MNKNIAVIVAVNDESLFSRYVLSSPGLKELDVQIIPIKEAKSAAEAYEKGLKQTKAQWLIYCHQDVYFPKGSGLDISKILFKIPKTDVPNTIIGFVGLEGTINQPDKKFVGTVTTIGHLLDWTESESAITIDELAVVMHRDCEYKIDAGLGWHWWATDLCLQAALAGHYARVVRVLVEHLSSHDYYAGGLPSAFYTSMSAIANKYLKLDIIHSLCMSFYRPKRSLRRPPRLGR